MDEEVHLDVVAHLGAVEALMEECVEGMAISFCSQSSFSSNWLVISCILIAGVGDLE